MRHANLLIPGLLLSAASLFASDTKVRTVKHLTVSDSSRSTPWEEETLYVQGRSQRKEFSRYADPSQIPQVSPQPHVAVISRCDTGVGYEIDFDNREYREFTLPKYSSQRDVEKEMAAKKKEAEKDKQNTIVDTGETRDFHGHKARHVITTMKIESRWNPSKKTLDGWYLDIPEPGCAPEYIRRNVAYETVVPLIYVGGPHGNPQYSVGPSPALDVVPKGIAVMQVRSPLVPEGLAILQKMVHRPAPGSGNDKEVVVETQVIDFSEAPLDPALFEVPPGFTKVKELHKHDKSAKH